MTHKYKIYDESVWIRFIYFNKDIELRLFDDKRKLLQIGDTIIFKYKGQRIKRKVVGLLYAKHFLDIVRTHGLERCGMSVFNYDTLMAKYYSKEDEERLGVVGILLEAV